MTEISTLSEFAARLREFIHSSQGGGRRAEGGIGTGAFQVAGARKALSANFQKVIADRADNAVRAPGQLDFDPTRLRVENSPRDCGCEFNRMALGLFALQFAHNAPCRKFCQSRGATPETTTEWSAIPAMPTSAFKELALTSLLPAKRTNVFHSSGTTEQRPSRHFHSPESLTIYEASLLPWFAAHLLASPPFGPGEFGGKRPPSPRSSPLGEGESSPAKEQSKFDFRILSLTPSAKEAPNSSLVHMFETVQHEFGSAGSHFMGGIARDGAWTLELNKTIHSLGKESDQPVLLLGTAFNFVHLLDHLGGNKLPLPSGSRVLETGGYKGRSRELPKAELHALIIEKLGIPESHIVSEYGMSELSSQAYDGQVRNSECGAGSVERVFRFPPWARVKIISPETASEVGEGETGLIRVFDLANVWSVMAIQTEDLAVRRGDGFELRGRASVAEPRGCSLMSD